MKIRGAMAGSALLAAAAGAHAADLGVLGEPMAPYPTLVPAPAIVVPACAERTSAVLMRCLPRREIVEPTEVGLIRIERAMGPQPVRPYKQLFTWP